MGVAVMNKLIKKSVAALQIPKKEELGACRNCPDYRWYRAHALTPDGLKISCEAQCGMVVVRTDISSFKDCEVFQRVAYRQV